MIECKKCKEPSSVIIRKKDSYCTNCFVTNTNHKFRSCIGKNKILSSNEKVLICLSGGPGSTVLLDLIYNGLIMDNHKKLRIVPYFLHILGKQAYFQLRKSSVSVFEYSSDFFFVLVHNCCFYCFFFMLVIWKIKLN